MKGEEVVWLRFEIVQLQEGFKINVLSDVDNEFMYSCNIDNDAYLKI